MSKSIPQDMQADTFHATRNSGNLVIVDYMSAKKVLVKFINTGHIKEVSSGNIRKMSVCDPYAKTFCGIGYVGEGDYKSIVNGKRTRQYTAWAAMLSRCYNPNKQIERSTYADCYVCDDWHNYQTFAKWYDENHPNDDGRYSLDKDIKKHGNRIYSPSTCLFVTDQSNNECAHSKVYRFKSPTDEIYSIYNLSKFCRAHELTVQAMYSVNNNKLNHHKGWTKA